MTILPNDTQMPSLLVLMLLACWRWLSCCCWSMSSLYYELNDRTTGHVYWWSEHKRIFLIMFIHDSTFCWCVWRGHWWVPTPALSFILSFSRSEELSTAAHQVELLANSSLIYCSPNMQKTMKDRMKKSGDAVPTPQFEKRWLNTCICPFFDKRT